MKPNSTDDLNQKAQTPSLKTMKTRMSYYYSIDTPGDTFYYKKKTV